MHLFDEAAGVSSSRAEAGAEEVRNMFLRFLLLLAIVPLVELWLLIEMTKRTSLGWTILLVLSTGFIGMNLVRWQGIRTVQKIQQQLAARQSPSLSIISGVLVLLAGALLLTPGLLTDTAGFLLLVPKVRAALAGTLQKRFVSQMISGVQSSVWVSSFSTGPPQPPTSENFDSAERPHVRVVNPDERRIDKS
jgi:UPF0716 protein FxsA